VFFFLIAWSLLLISQKKTQSRTASHRHVESDDDTILIFSRFHAHQKQNK